MEDDITPMSSEYYSSQMPQPLKNTDYTYNAQLVNINIASAIRDSGTYQLNALTESKDSGSKFLKTQLRSPKARVDYNKPVFTTAPFIGRSHTLTTG